MGTEPSPLTATEAQALKAPAPESQVIGCAICGAYPHRDWCENIAGKIYDRFNSTYREIYNVIELSLDEKRAEIAKSLIGHKLTETRNDCTALVANYFKKNSKL